MREVEGLKTSATCVISTNISNHFQHSSYFVKLVFGWTLKVWYLLWSSLHLFLRGTAPDESAVVCVGWSKSEDHPLLAPRLFPTLGGETRPMPSTRNIYIYVSMFADPLEYPTIYLQIIWNEVVFSSCFQFWEKPKIIPKFQKYDTENNYHIKPSLHNDLSRDQILISCKKSSPCAN